MVADTENVTKPRSGFGLNELLGARLPQTMTARKSGLATEDGPPGRAPESVSTALPKSRGLGRGWDRAHAPPAAAEARQGKAPGA